MAINKWWQASAPDKPQLKVEVRFDKFYSSNFIKSWSARTPIQHYIGWFIPLKWTWNQFTRLIIQSNIHFNYSGKYHAGFLVDKTKPTCYQSFVFPVRFYILIWYHMAPYGRGSCCFHFLVSLSVSTHLYKGRSLIHYLKVTRNIYIL